MSSDLTNLVRRDHDDLDQMLVALTDPVTPDVEAVALLETLQMGFAAHMVAQCTALQEILGPAPSPRALSMIVDSIRDEHHSQARALAALALAGVKTIAWTARALALRVQLQDHATRAEFMRVSLSDHVSVESQQALASRYASERLRHLVILDVRPNLSAFEVGFN